VIMSENKKFSIEYNTRLTGFLTGNSQKYSVSVNGKIRTAKINCQECGSADYVDNGYHAVEDSIITQLGLKILIAQFHCKKCNTFWSTNREIIDKLIIKEKDFVKSLMLGCVRNGLSFENASTVVAERTGVNYSGQYLSELYNGSLDQVKQEKISSASGVYHYDEQFLLVNGEKKCRVTVKDAVTGKVVIDVQTEDAKKETIKQVLQQALEGLPVDVFIIDMRQEYPELLHELFPNAKIQWCIFHLYKLIWKELRDEYGKSIPLHELYNAYTLFNIFFNHDIELEKLKLLMQKFESSKTNNEKSNRELVKTLRKKFAKFVNELKKQRRRDKQNIPRRTLQESEKKFADVYMMIGLYTKKLQKRIRFIKENWERFTLFQRDSRVQPTNNGLEQYFAATLSKTDKKDFRSIDAVTRELNACRAEWNGYRLFKPVTNLAELLKLAGKLFLAFQFG
jgi:hypothetical protein